MQSLEAQIRFINTALADGTDAAISVHSADLSVIDAAGMQALDTDDLSNLQAILQRLVDSGITSDSADPMSTNNLC